jgi:hypothetical protein
LKVYSYIQKFIVDSFAEGMKANKPEQVKKKCFAILMPGEFHQQLPQTNLKQQEKQKKQAGADTILRRRIAVAQLDRFPSQFPKSRADQQEKSSLHFTKTQKNALPNTTTTILTIKA